MRSRTCLYIVHKLYFSDNTHDTCTGQACSKTQSRLFCRLLFYFLEGSVAGIVEQGAV